MPTYSSSLAGDFESAKQQMLDALSRASSELSEVVNDCTEQLALFNFGLQKSLSDQLQQLERHSRGYVEGSLDELIRHKEELLGKLAQFERSEIETIVGASSKVRQAISEHAERAEDNILRLCNQYISELELSLEAPENQLSAEANEALCRLSCTFDEGQGQIAKTLTAGEELLTGTAQDLEQELRMLLERSQEQGRQKAVQTSATWVNMSRSAQETVTTRTENHLEELSKAFADGAARLASASLAQRDNTTKSLERWKAELSESYNAFLKTMEAQQDDFEQRNRCEFEDLMSDAKNDLEHISSEAIEQVRALHKLLQHQLKRADQEYRAGLESTLASFEATLSELQRRSSSAASKQTRKNAELNDRLSAQLSSRGSEATKAIERLAEKRLSEYNKTAQKTHERIANIKAAALEAMDKQVQQLRQELAKVIDAFQIELVELESQVPEIEAAGRMVASTVAAYRSSWLFLDDE